MCNLTPYKVNYITQAFGTNPKSIVLDEFTNALTIKNTGTTLCLINEDPLNPGESKFFGGNAGEVFDAGTRFDVRFVIQVPAPATVVNLCQVTTKIYTNIRK
jgi:hypothetical protein